MVSARGGSQQYFGDYDLYVGCTSSSVTFTDSPDFITSVPIFVGANLKEVYEFKLPSSSRAYCVVEEIRLVD